MCLIESEASILALREKTHQRKSSKENYRLLNLTSGFGKILE